MKTTFEVKLLITTNTDVGGNPAKWDWHSLICEYEDETVYVMETKEVNDAELV